MDRIAFETENIIDEMMPRPLRQGRLVPEEDMTITAREMPILSGVSGYVRYINTRRLVILAKSYGLTVRVLRRVGHFVPAGVPLMTVSKGHKISSGHVVELLGTFDIGPTRTLQQDMSTASCRSWTSR